ncbi:5768_t:CDS:2, partial [Funneliformis caledonium]
MRPEYEVTGDESSRRIDFAIKLENSFQMNKKKRKQGDDDDFDYLYGIVTTAWDWHFLLYTLGVISQGDSKEYQTLRSGVKKVLDIIVGLLRDRTYAEDNSSSKKKARIE